MESYEEFLRALAELSPDEQEQVRDYVTFLRWRSAHGRRPQKQAAHRPWQYSCLEHFDQADVRATKSDAGMELKVAEAIVGGEPRPSLWEHPPVHGEAVVEYHVPITNTLRDLRLRFAIGIRDGANPRDGRLVAFRVRVNGWQVWSQAAWPRRWEPVEVELPFQEGDVLRLAFATDGLGSHEFAWAAWAEPMLSGIEEVAPGLPTEETSH